jgi:3-oxoacyl-[acyl-carrier-protein] synthase-1
MPSHDNPPLEAMVVGVGARAHNGLSALQVAMSCRAGLMDPQESHMIDRHGEPIAMCRIMTVSDRVQGMARFVALAAPALAEALEPWRQAEAARRVAAQALPLCLALPHRTRPGLDPKLPARLIPELALRAPVAIDQRASRVVTGCRGGGVAAFEAALELLQHGAPAVVVGGVDSYFDPDVLEHLDACRRLHGLETENGFIPGEGAAFLVLARVGSTAGLHRYARLLGAVTVAEPRPWDAAAPPEREPCLALGMTSAVERAVARAGTAERSIGWILTDVANERHRVDEWTFAWLRNEAAFEREAVHEQPLLETGDVGAASAAMLVALASVRWQARCGVSPRALIAAHSDGPERGALVLAEAS